MPHDSTTPRELPPLRRCGSYRAGHEVHYIQGLKSYERGPGELRTIRNIDDDGTISFTDGTTAWHHDPERLRAALAESGSAVRLGAYGVLRVPRPDGAYAFSVSDDVDPCRPETAEDRPGESVVDELLRRGGFLRRGKDVRAEE